MITSGGLLHGSSQKLILFGHILAMLLGKSVAFFLLLLLASIVVDVPLQPHSA
jgi:hypothetical protein